MDWTTLFVDAGDELLAMWEGRAGKQRKMKREKKETMYILYATYTSKMTFMWCIAY